MQWLVLFPQSKRVVGLIPGSGPFCVEFACSPCDCMGSLQVLQVLQVLHTVQKHANWGLVGLLVKLEISCEYECGWLFVVGLSCLSLLWVKVSLWFPPFLFVCFLWCFLFNVASFNDYFIISISFFNFRDDTVFLVWVLYLIFRFLGESVYMVMSLIVLLFILF